MPEEHISASTVHKINAAAANVGLTLDSTQIVLLTQYLALIAKWNRVYNLTAIRDNEQMLVQHLFDSLSVVSPMLTQLPDGVGTVVDVGSGAGLPGVVIAIAAPAVKVICVDAVGKKASFVQQVASELRLGNLTARHSRIEKLDNGPVDLITARAFSSLADLVSLSAHVLKPSGVWMAMKGKRPDDEIAALPTGTEVFHVEQLKVTGLIADRCIVWMRRNTPKLSL